MLGKVKFHGNGGYDCEKQDALAILEVGKEYEVEWVDVGGWYSTYKLVGYERQFNTVLFEDSPIFDNALKQWWANYYGKN